MGNGPARADTTPAPVEAAGAQARALVRSGLKGALATLDRDTGNPYASLVTLATDAAGAPVFLISALARHTQNLEADPRASILVEAAANAADPLALGRVSLWGRAAATDDPSHRARFLARHPEAADYADFGDFAFWRLEIEAGHYVGGFGRIVTLPADALLTAIDGAGALLDAEREIVAHMNEDHADAIALYATRLLGEPKGDWRMTGCDPSGCDLLSGTRPARLDFDAPVSTPGEARKQLAALAKRARG